MKPLFMLYAILILSMGTVRGGESAAGAPVRFAVGTKEAPPFSYREAGGAWAGLSIDLWREIAAELNITYEFRELPLPELLEGLKNRSLDAVVAAVTVTEEREGWCDFTHPFHLAGLGIAVRPGGGKRWRAVLARIFSGQFLVVVGMLILIIFLVGVVVWLFERRRNPEQFGGEAAGGIAAAFWWSVVTMTTVGYGDKSPRTVLGRLIAVVWMFAGIILISTFTASITAALTVTDLTSRIQGPEDLPSARVGSIPGTTSARYLERRAIPFESFSTPREALEALSGNRVDAVVYDGPVLRHLVGPPARSSIRILPTSVERQHYAIGLVTDSPLRERINRILLQKMSGGWWDDQLRRYLGVGG